MPDRIAIKVLTPSDLTFFDTFHRRSNVGNQKAINLNADVFAKQFYPDFTEKSQGEEVEVAVSVTIYGPRTAKAYRFPRSITKKNAYKNWRLNGAAVPDPEDEIGRFDHLQPGDLAIIEFQGDAAPEIIQIVIISSQDDPELCAQLKSQTPGGRRTMAPVSREYLSEVAIELEIAPDHPIRAILADAELEAILEQAQLGVAPAVRRLKEHAGRRLTKSDLRAARLRAERIGEDGEALALLFLEGLVAEGKLPAVKWTASENAAASWDFETVEGELQRFDAKATGQNFNAPFHLSGAETAAAADATVPYRIIRLYELTEDGARVRLSKNINALAKKILDQITHLPDGVLPIGFTIAPQALEWEDPLWIERPDEPAVLDNGAIQQQRLES